MSWVVGIVGAIASGKTTAAKWFAARGWTLVDADVEAHALYSPGSKLVDDLVRRFGPEILRDDGTVDRSVLGRMVFGDSRALSDLDALVHPLARERIRLTVEGALERDENVVLEMALLHRWPEMANSLDSIVGIRSSDTIRQSRLSKRSGLSLQEAERRIASQDQDLLLSIATTVISNDATRPELERSLERLFGAKW